MEELQQYLSYETTRSCRKWCERMGLTKYRDVGTLKWYILQSDFETVYTPFPNSTKQNHSQLFSYPVNIVKLVSRAIMDDPMVGPLKYPKSKKWKGLYAYCNHCGYNLTETCKENNKNVTTCPFKDKHIFRAYYHVPGTKNSKKARKFFTRDVDEAIRGAMQFEQEVKHGSVAGPSRSNKYDLKLANGSLLTVEAAIIGYLEYLDNKGVRSSMQRERSSDYKKDVARKLNLVKEALRAKGHDPLKMPVNQLSASVVDEVFDYFKEQTSFSNNTFNKHFSHVSSLLQWVSNEHQPVPNWFKKVRKQHTQYRPKAISFELNDALLKIIRPDNGIAELHSGVKPQRNYYRAYLKDAFRLALETGRRREEIIKLKYDAIKEFPDGGGYIKIEDFKMNRIEGRTKEEEKKYHFVPITKSLRKLLNEMGYEKYSGSNKFILNPEGKEQRNRAMSDNLSRAFSHYYSQLETREDLSFKAFRKTYITNQAIYLRGSELASKIIGHTNQGTTNKHYIDPELIARALKDFEVFPSEMIREKDLQELRTNQLPSKNNQLEK